MQLNNPQITLTSTAAAAPEYDITDEVASCTFEVSKGIISRNTFGTVGQQRNKKGRFDGSLAIDFNQDYSATGAISRVFFGYLIADDVIDVVVTSGPGAVSASNPSYVFQVAVDSLPVIDGDADSLATASITLQIHGEVTEVTA